MGRAIRLVDSFFSLDGRGLCDPETRRTTRSATGRPSAPGKVPQPVIRKRIKGHIALNGRAPAASTTMSAQWEVAGSSPAVSTEMTQRRVISPHRVREIHSW